ncbi:hypothetical protein J8F10_00390 [Gemmata sp. G18]|uniref:DUF4347 domain-containing protein n=1 Tax=Gemmata palustris TaxID=2822762 RepID=A0ABS5BJ94_9BACT|nr:hypothetical protein [Gemmata palustris]MBP3953759.1 hypothetical protein [Gemmata palustris]
MRFDRVLFQTHGVPETIWAGSRGIGDIDPSTWLSRFAGWRFHRPFPFDTLVYFGGCGAGAADSGTQLLVEAGKMFTRSDSGEVFVFTNSVRVPGVDAVHRRQNLPPRRPAEEAAILGRRHRGRLDCPAP